MKSSYFVYILKCFDDSYYVGVTNDIERRIFEHESGFDPNSYTFNKRPLKQIYYEEFLKVMDAILFEKQLKGWTKEKKKALIREDWDEIVRLSNLK